MTSIDVTLVAFRSADLIAEAITSAQQLGGSTIVVVDHHGRDGSAEIARRLGAHAVVDESNPGFGAGHNRAVGMTQAPYVLLLNPDARIDASAVRRGADHLDAHPDVAAVQGAIVNRSTGQLERSSGVLIRPTHLVGRALGLRRLLRLRLVRQVARSMPTLRDHARRRVPSPTSVEWLAATVLLVRREAFDEVGGFDESYFLYGEDQDLCRRLGEAGWRLTALPEEWAEHVSGGSTSAWGDREVVWWEGTMRYAALWWSTPAFATALLAAAAQLIRIARHRPASVSSDVRRMVVEPVRSRWRSVR